MAVMRLQQDPILRLRSNRQELKDLTPHGLECVHEFR